jgi:hypothetical protein
MAAQCLEHYSGEIVLHVGEMVFTGTAMGAPVAPFGRTSSADFQVSLAENFHCLLMAKLSETYPLSKDCVSVWKRTKLVSGRDHQSLVTDETNQAPANNKKNVKGDEEGGNKKKKAKKSEDKKAPSSSSDSGGVEFISLSDLNALREAALDMQYNEENESKWASIPEDEQLPIDRAAPCLQHLLLHI